MKTSKILLIISIALLLNNCSKERKLWEEAKKLNTISNYENFINENPNSMFVDSAYVKIEQIKSFLKADSLATISSYEDFLVSFPSGSLDD